MTMADAIRAIRRKILGSVPARKQTEELAEDVHAQAQLLKEELEEVRQHADRDFHGDVLGALIHAMRRNQFNEIAKNNPNLD